jgi:hypothetical protein
VVESISRDSVPVVPAAFWIFTVTGAATGLQMNILDPGTGRSGLIAAGSAALNTGTFTIDGVMYGGGDFSSNGIPGLTVHGAVVFAGNTQLNAGGVFSLSFVQSRVDANFGGTATPTPLETKHWEEEY